MINNKFTPEQEAWLVELETTDKLQGKLNLKALTENNKECFCCLGIACELFEPKGFVLQHEDDSIFSINGKSSGLPSNIQNKLNLYKALGQSRKSGTYALFELNDDHNKSFKEIAAIIRENPHHYFTNFKQDWNDI